MILAMFLSSSKKKAVEVIDDTFLIYLGFSMFGMKRALLIIKYDRFGPHQ
jgi:hypothetical protein